MRILLAVDGSVSSDRAVELVTTLALPPDSLVRVISVQQPYVDVLALSWGSVGVSPGAMETEEQEESRIHREAIERAETALAKVGQSVEGFLVRGRPAGAIVDEAKAMRADLVVVGSRGHSTIATMVLGSTAAEIVDHSPCPVLVARGNTLGAVAFADDGSDTARTAERVLTDWPIFAGVSVTVVTVAETAVPVSAGFTPGLYDQVLASYSEAVDAAREEVRQEADSEVQRLSRAGHRAEPVTLEGDPAGEICRYATAMGVGTIVLGTHGRTGLARMVLGSVARNVLLHAHCSVLIVRAPR
jgi:nucleotide-binding universal stress UspA family protein